MQPMDNQIGRIKQMYFNFHNKNLMLKSIMVLSTLMIFSCKPKSPSTVDHPIKSLKSGETRIDPFTGLEVMVEREKDRKFSLYMGPKPPIKVTETMNMFPIPALSSIENRNYGPLKVLRAHPTGHVSNMGALTVAFNQPMIALTTLEEQRKTPAPISIDPKPPGKFKWLGTTVVAFEPEKKFPFATNYVVKIPKGIKSASGNVLAATQQFVFETPRVQLTQNQPYNGDNHAIPETAIVLQFNQKISAAHISTMVIVKDGLTSIPFKVVPFDKWKTVKPMGKYFKSWKKNRTVVLKPKSDLRKGTRYNVIIKRGIKSLEGPLLSKKEKHFYFTTYSPLKLDGVGCGITLGPCKPDYAPRIQFNNSIRINDKKLLKYIKIRPIIKELKLKGYGNNIYIHGIRKPAVTYKVTVKKSLSDIYEQSLGKNQKKSVKILDANPNLILPASKHAVIERKEGTSLKVSVINNMTKATITLVKIDPKQVMKTLGLVRNYYWNYSGRHSYRRHRSGSKQAGKIGKDGRIAGSKGPSSQIEGKRISYKKRLSSRKNKIEETRINLNKLLKGKGGIVFVEIYSPDLNYQYWSSPYRYMIVQVTDLGLTARYDVDKIITMATQLKTGKTQEKVTLELFKRVKTKKYREVISKKVWEGETDKNGMALAPGIRIKGLNGPYLLVAKKGKDMAFLPILGSAHDYGYVSSYSWYNNSLPKKRILLSHMFTDRNPYRPGDTVEITGILRAKHLVAGKKIVEPLKGKNLKVKYSIRDPRNTAVKEGEAKIDSDGVISIKFKTKPQFSTGYYRFNGEVKGAENIDTTHVNLGFQILAYRAPEHSTKVTIESKTHYFGEKLKGTIKGKYNFGAPMANAKVDWTLRRSRGWYRPAKIYGYSFNVNYHAQIVNGRYVYPAYSSIVKSGKSKLDKEGKLSLDLLLTKGKGADKLIGPANFTLESTVYDVNRQAIAGRKAVIVHQSDYYLGLKNPAKIVKEKKEAKISFIVATVDGKKIPGVNVTLKMFKQEYNQKKVKVGKYWSTRYVYKFVEKGKCTGVTTLKGGDCSITPKKSGYYIIKGYIKDPKGREIQSHSSIYIHKKNSVSRDKGNRKNIIITPEKSMYKPGETAKITISSPFKNAVGILAYEQNGIFKHKQIRFFGKDLIEKIIIKDSMGPNLNLSVSLVRGRIKKKAKKADTDQDPGRPMFAVGRRSISVSTESKIINVKVTPSKKVISPGEEIEVKIKASNFKGKPVPSRIAVMVVDEGVLSLMGFQTPNPIHYFHKYNSTKTALMDIRHWLLKKLKISERTKNKKFYKSNSNRRYRSMAKGAMAEESISPMVMDKDSFDDAKSRVVTLSASNGATGKSSNKRGGKRTFKVRKFFATTAYFNSKVYTDADGNATLKIKMPENLTEFRIMAVAMEKNVKDRYGKGEEKVKIRKRFMLRAALPRFANYGDSFEASVIVDNHTGKTGMVTVKIQGVGFQMMEKDTKTVEVENGKAKEIRFKVKTTRPGLARFRFSAFIGNITDAVQPPPIKINIPASSEATATYGVTTQSVKQPIKPPANVLSFFGGMDIHLSSTALTGLQDAVKFLVDYPYECTEQVASRTVPIFTLKKILTEFKIAKLSDKNKQNAIATRGIQKLVSMQRWNGGFPYWPKGYRAWPHISAYATWALVRAHKAGFKVPKATLKKAAKYLRNFMARSYKWKWGGWYYAYTSRIMAGWVLTQMMDMKFIDKYNTNKKDLLKYSLDLYKHKKHVGLFAKAWLASTLYRLQGKSSTQVKELMRILNNAAIETAGAVHFTEGTSQALKLLMHSNSRSDSIVLRTFMEVESNSRLIPKIVRGLMSARIKGTWETTQANAFALDSLSQYYKQYENIVPDFITNIWYGKGFIGSKSYKGRSMGLTHKRIPMSYLVKNGNSDLILSKKGKGKLYYRLGLTYVPASLKLKPEEQGFVVKRVYEPVADKTSVIKVKPGHWKIKAGSYVRVRLTVVVPDRRYYVALDDPMPAGLEGVDMQLKTTASSSLASKNQSAGSYWSWYWYRSPDFKEMRDDRYILFWDRLPAGTYEHTYLARATTIGKFIVPPLKASEMYSPEVFGRNGTEYVEIVK
jgi:alpha-2-macroglobulin